MNVKIFNAVIENQIDVCKKILCDRAVQYATEDRLHNFKAGAALTNKTPREILGGFMLKHTVSIYDMINMKGDCSLPLWEEKITDNINYLLLLKAIVVEEEAQRRATQNQSNISFDELREAITAYENSCNK